MATIAAVPAYADSPYLYDCPYLHDAPRHTTEAMFQGGNGWFYRKADFKTPFYLTHTTRDYLTRIKEAFEHNGSRLILLNIPLKSAVTSANAIYAKPYGSQAVLDRIDIRYREYIKSFKDIGLEVVSPIDTAIDHTNDEGGFYFKQDIHWSPEGAKLTAGAIASYLEQQGFPLPEGQRYSTKAGSKRTLNSTSGKEIRRLCVYNVPQEMYRQYTTQKSIAGGANALFGDEEETKKAALIGTSYSVFDMFNFEGFLSESLQMDVINYAIAQGGLTKSITSYSKQQDQDRIAPELVIWETSAHYDFNRAHNTYRQIIAGLYGSCNAEHSVTSGEIDLKEGKTVNPIKIAEEKKITGTDYYLVVTSDEPQLLAMQIIMEYADGDGDIFLIDHTENYINSRQFFIELRDEIRAPLISLSIQASDQSNSKLEIKVCKKPV